MPVPGWRRVPGERRYFNPAGENVSEYQYRNALAKQSGWDSYWDYRKTARDRDWIAERREAMIEQRLSKWQTGMTSDLAESYTTARDARRSGAPNLNDADGPLADYLVYIGRRDPDWDFAVGDTGKASSGLPASK